MHTLVSGTINNNLLLFITVKLMPLVGSWIAANLLVRVLFRANIYSIFIRLFTNTDICLFTVIAATEAVCHCLMVYNDRAINQMVYGDFALYHLK